VTYFSILGFLNISGISKATNCLKFVNGDDGNLRAELPSWSRAKLIVGGGWEGGFGGLCPPKLNICTICIPVSQFSILLAILFMNVLKMLKISQPVTFSPHPPLYQLEASCGNLVSSWLNYASELYKRCHLLHKNLLILFVYLCSCGMVY